MNLNNFNLNNLSVNKKLRRACFLLTGLLLLAGCSEEPKPIDITFGVADQPSSALVHIALAKGYFAAEQLNVQVSHFPSGKRALIDGYGTGAVDYVTASDAPFVLQVSTDMPELRLLATLYTADNINRIVARKDAGISKLEDLAGKRVATQSNSAVHFFLHSIVKSQRLDHDQLEISYMKAGELPEALAAGDIDAFSMREPYVTQARELLGENALVLASPGLYVQSEVLLVRDSALAAQPEAAKRLLRALIKAEEFVATQPEQAINLLAEALEADPQGIRDIWNELKFEVRLNQSVLFQFERMIDWLVTDVDPTLKAPNFLNHIESRTLADLSNDRVSIVQ